MTKLEFMKELESLLSDIPLEEREEALSYYYGYFEDAGEDHEEEIIKELVSPAKVASTIKADLNSNAAERESRGYFTENGYKDTIYSDERYTIVGAGKKEDRSNSSKSSGSRSGAQSSDSANYSQYSGNNTEHSTSQQSDRNAQQGTRNTNIGLIVLLCIFGFPFIMSAFGILFGVVVAIVSILFSFGAVGIALIGVGIACIIAGLIQISVPFVGLLLCGGGLLVIGLGMLFTLACIMLCKKVLPALIRGVVNICKRPFQNRSVAA